MSRKTKDEQTVDTAANDVVDVETTETVDTAAVEQGDEPDDGLPKFSVDQLLKSSTYSHRRDLLRSLLDTNKQYSHAQIANIMKAFNEKEVT